MKTFRKYSNLVAFATIALVTFVACEDISLTTPSDTTDTEVAEDETLISMYYEDVYDDMEDAENSYYSPLKSALSDELICREVSHEKIGDTLVTTITYHGDCQYEINGELHYKSGIVKITRYGGRKFTEGATRIIELIDFEVDSAVIEGTQTIVSNGLNADSTEVLYDIMLTGGKVTFPDGLFATRDSRRTRLHIVGEELFNRRDDEIYINGTSEGVNLEGLTYTTTLVNLHKVFGCPFFISGTITMEVDGKDPVVIDYGDDTCDRLASCEKNGDKSDFNIRNRYEKRHRNGNGGN